MIATNYTPEHFKMIDPWFKSYGLSMHEFLLPRTGVIVEGCAVGFLFLTNSPQAWVENFCRNPEIDKDTASKALDLVCEGLINLAKENDVKLLVANTVFDFISDRAKRYQFTQDEMKFTHLYRSF